jgi:hypothetical protein
LSAPNTGAHAHDHADHDPEDPDEVGELLRLLGVVVTGGLHIELQARIGGHRRLELLEARLAGQLDGHGLECRPAVGVADRLGVGPELGFMESPDVKGADDRPRLVRKIDLLAGVETTY